MTRAGGPLVLGVTAVDGRLEWAVRAADPEFAGMVAEIGAALAAPLAPDYVSELCPRVDPWIASLAAVLERGALLLFDYGLPRAQVTITRTATAARSPAISNIAPTSIRS